MKKTIIQKLYIPALVLLGCFAMSAVELYMTFYPVKFLLKTVCFSLLPLIYFAYDRSLSFRFLFRLRQKRQIFYALMFGIFVYIFILLCYFTLRSWIDLDLVARNLKSSANITPDNFLYVSIYISIFNSFLEELFFRGFAFLTLRKKIAPKIANLFSALAFAFFHVSIMANWFSLRLFMLMTIGLFAAGLFFNWLDRKTDNVYNSWLVHMCANLSINTIGFMMFGMI